MEVGDIVKTKDDEFSYEEIRFLNNKHHKVVSVNMDNIIIMPINPALKQSIMRKYGVDRYEIVLQSLVLLRKGCDADD